MAKEDVNIKVSANVAEAIRIWQAMEEGPKGMADELDKLGRKGKRASSGMSDEFAKLVGQWATIGAAIVAAKKTLLFFIDAQKESLRLTGEATVPVDELSRRFQVQSGSTNVEAERAREAILGIAQQRGVTPQGAFNPATQLVSSGFGADEVTEGGSLDEFLKLINATNATREDVNSSELAKALVQFLTATQQDLTAEAIRENSVAIQGLFKSTNLQTAQLGRFAPEAGVINQFTGLKQELLPLLSQFLDVTDVAKGATAFRASVVSLATAGATPKKSKGLESIGLSPEDVDFVGEDFFTVQKRLADALDSVSKDKANIAAKLIFGQDALIAQSVLFSQQGVAETQRRLAISGDQQAFDRDVGITEGSLVAKGRSAESRAGIAFFGSDFIDPVTARSNMMSRLREEGFGNTSLGLAGLGFDTRTFLGGDAEAAVEAGVFGSGILGDDNLFFSQEEKSKIKDILNKSRASQPQDIKIQVELTDQNAVAIPHKSQVNELNR